MLESNVRQTSRGIVQRLLTVDVSVCLIPMLTVSVDAAADWSLVISGIPAQGEWNIG